MNFKKFWIIFFAAIFMINLCACSQHTPEKSELKTTLSIKTGFSGTRIIECHFSPDIFPQNSEKAENLHSIITNSCPKTLTYSHDDSQPLTYKFTLSFTSASDYAEKIESLLGTAPVISFANPDNVLTKGWRIEESFQSSQLLAWIQTAADQEHFDGFEHSYTETETSISYNGESISTLPVISVNQLNGYPIKKIGVETVNNKPLYDRTISFTIAQSTFDSTNGEIKKYFESITDPSAEKQWPLSGNDYIYTVKFRNLTLKQLEGYTNRLLGSIYGDAEYLDKAVGSSPLASQNSYTETLDFSNYISDNHSNVPVEYTYSVGDKSELGICMVYSESKWSPAEHILETNSVGKKAAIAVSTPTLTVKINDGMQYLAKSIDISLSALDGESLQKTYSFCYNLANDGYEASAYTQSYFSTLGITSEVNTKDDTSICTIKFTGTAPEINTKISDLFGNSNIINSSSQVPFMTMRTIKSISDHIDISALLVGKNSDTLVTYTVNANNNDTVQDMKYKETATSLAAASDPLININDDGSRTVSIIDGRGDITAEISAPNITDIIIFSVISFIILLISITIILILRTRKPELPALEESPKTPELKNPKKPKALK